MSHRRFPIKSKLTVATLLPLSVAVIICWLTGVFIMNTRIVSEAQQKVRNDLNAAREIYSNEIGHIRDVVKFTAYAPYTAGAFATGNRKTIAALLTPLGKSEKLDILTAVDARGRVLFRTRNPGVFGDDRSRDPFVIRALRGEMLAGTDVLSPEEMAAEGPDLARQASIDVVKTPLAKPDDERMERSGMLIAAAAPVRDETGKILGVLYGGVLLNNNNSLVDRIKSIVYEGVKFQGKDVGGATIFLGDIRIATNVITTDGKRAIGTRLSEEVYNRVMLRRERWVGRAFVVNDWYFSAYEPIFSPDGVPVGSLYAGMLEKPYSELKLNMSLLYSGVLLMGTLIGLAVSGFVSSRLARPIRELENMARRVAAGERDVRITIDSRDEIGDLAGEFNQMTGSLAQREAEIRTLNRELERKVLERTAQLEEKNIILLKTQQELVKAEKLAAVGELAAGVAHEINNPMAIIRGNAELLQMAIPDGNPSREEVDTIAQQVGRVERIVANLLKFARRERKHLGTASLNRMLDEILSQVGHQIPLSGITIRKDYQEGLPEIEGDADQLRQVFTNLILNAIQAMEGTGVITVATAADIGDGTCHVTIADSGRGIAREELDRIFNPFFTTKTNGTGLGLSVSYGIVKDHGGRIDVASDVGKGSLFRIILPLTQNGTAQPSARIGEAKRETDEA